jgi:signal transduction histidine kinase
MKSLRVLVVDDDPKFLEKTEETLSREKYSVATAADFDSAAASIRHVRGRTVVLTGLKVGNKTGIMFLQETLKKFPQIPFIFLSSSPSLESVIGALKEGAYDFLRKPVDPGILLHSVARAVQKLNLSLDHEKHEKETHDRLAHLQADLKQARDLGAYKGFLVSMVGHDFKSILTVLDGYMQILNEKCAACTQKEPTQLMEQAGRTLTRLRTMANTLLDYEAAESGQLRIEPKEFGLIAVLNECVAFYKPYAEQKNVNIRLEDKLPGIKVRGDAGRVFQILDNLLYNAIKFTPSGGEIRLGAREENNGFATAWVHDTGIGIPKAIHEKIFTESQILSGGNDGTARIGLGLNIARKLIEIQNGRIWLESEPGKGTKVLFSLPT